MVYKLYLYLGIREIIVRSKSSIQSRDEIKQSFARDGVAKQAFVTRQTTAENIKKI